MTGDGPRPLLSYQVAEDRVGSECAPSYALRGGIDSVPSNAYTDTGMIRFALQQGWALVVPDYQGPDSDLFDADGYVHGVLDGIRAARAFAPAAVDPAAPIGMWGYSGGAQATAIAAQAHSTYAPELRLTGVALGGIVADLEATMSGFSGGIAGGGAGSLAWIDHEQPRVERGGADSPRGRWQAPAELPVPGKIQRWHHLQKVVGAAMPHGAARRVSASSALRSIR